MKKFFETPIVKVIVFETKDILASGSGEVEEDKDGFWTEYA